jgi:mRNA interferase MazF
MRSGTTYSQGEILIVPFPFSDLSAVKKRPVLVVSTKKYNDSADDLVICGITSNLKNSNFSVLFDNKDLVSGKIPAPSRIKADKLFTIEKTKVIKSVGLVSEKVLNDVKDEMIKLFGF